MNPNQPSREPIEARLTALLLGELPAAEAELLRYTISQDAALKKLHDRLAATIVLVREAEKNPVAASGEKDVSLKLSAGRRQKLLAHFQTPRPKPKELFWLNRIEVPPLVTALAVLALLALLAALLLPVLARSKSRSVRARVSAEARLSEITAPMVADNKPPIAAPATPASVESLAEIPPPVVPSLPSEPALTPPPVQIVLPRTGLPPEVAAATGPTAGSEIGGVHSANAVGYVNLNVAAPNNSESRQLTLTDKGGNRSKDRWADTQKHFSDVKGEWGMPSDSGVVFGTGAPASGPAGSARASFSERLHKIITDRSGGKNDVAANYYISSPVTPPAFVGSPVPVRPVTPAHSLDPGWVGTLQNREGLARNDSGAIGSQAENKPQNIDAEHWRQVPAQKSGAGTLTFTEERLPQIALREKNQTDQQSPAGLRDNAIGSGRSAAPSAGRSFDDAKSHELAGDKAPVLGDLPVLGSLFQSSPQEIMGAPRSAANPLGAFPGNTLAGANTYNGGTTINVGTLAFEDGKTSVGNMTGHSDSDELRNKNIPLKYANPSDIQQAIQSLLPDKRSKVVADAGTGGLRMTGTDNDIQIAEDVVRKLDAPLQQVFVEALPKFENRATLQAREQSTTTTTGNTGTSTGSNGVGGFGGFGGATAGIGNPGTGGSTGYNHGTVGTANISVDPTTHNLVVIADKKTEEQIRKTLSQLDVPKSAANPLGAFPGNTLAGANTFTGGTPISGGTMTLSGLSGERSITLEEAGRSLGVNLQNRPGKVIFDRSSNSLLVYAKEQDLEKIAQALSPKVAEPVDHGKENPINNTGDEFSSRMYRLKPGIIFSESPKPATDQPLPKPPPNAPVPQPEFLTRENGFSTFSMNVSDVSFKLAAASLEKGRLPDPASIRSEEFINAFDYRDPAAAGQPVAFADERAQDPFALNRDFLRFSLKTAALGRAADRPLNLVLLLDTSGSMERADRVAIIREAMRVLAAQLHPRDTVSVVTFARTARLWADGVRGDQAGETLSQVGGITPEGGTNLEEAMQLAYETARRHYLANGINRVVLLTDGAANLGNVDAAALQQKVEAQRRQGIALDCFGIGWEDYNDEMLAELSGNGDGRYAFINSPEEAGTEFAAKLAGALRVAAQDVKVQVEFNPQRVTSWRQIGYAKHQLTKEQFRDNSVLAAEIAAQEAGNALYTVEIKPDGTGPVATVYVRYKVPGTEDVSERSWLVEYIGPAPALDQASPAMRLAATAAAFSEWLAQSPFAQQVTPDELLKTISGVPQVYGGDPRPKELETMIREAKSLSGK